MVRSSDKGSILVDVITALALSALFISLLTQATIESRDIFERAKVRNDLLDAYILNEQKINSLLPYQSLSIQFEQGSTTGILNASASWYGNDRIETIVKLTSFLLSFRKQDISFDDIRSHPFSSTEKSVGQALCSVDFLHDRSVSTSSIVLPINSSIPLTHLEVRNNIAYISTDSTNTPDPDLFIVDIASSTNTKIISSINTGPGLSTFSLVGNRIYAAAASTVAQLHIIRLDSLNSPVLETKYQLNLPYATATPPYASAIFFHGNKIYLGTEKWIGPEFSIIDVSDPLKLIELGHTEINSKINDIFIRDNYAYLATANAKQFMVLNISNPSSPSEIDSYNPSGYSRQEGKTLSFFEDGLNGGRTSGGFDITQDHELFYWNKSPTTTNSFVSTLISSQNIPGGVYGVIPDRKHIFLATRQTGKELQIFSQELSTSTPITYSLPIIPQSMTCDGNKLYILAADKPQIYVITSK